MTCFNPIYAYRLKSAWRWKINTRAKKPKLKIPNKGGDILLTKEYIDINKKNRIPIPCGKCIGCRLDKANDWATRNWTESKYWKNNCFITLTYDEKNLPRIKLNILERLFIGTKNIPTLRKKDLQDFWKRLRYYEKGIEEWTNPRTKKIEKPIRYFECGEYGPNLGRPHYHAGIFNWIPKDLKYYKDNKVGDKLYTSETLQKIWGKGFVIIGELSYESACYISRYVQKKAYIEEQEDIEIKSREKEFVEVSRNGGIGLKYWEDNKEKIKANNGIWIKTKDSVKLKPIPAYIKKKWKEEDEDEYYTWALKNEENAKKKWKEILKKTDLNEKEYLKLKKIRLTEKAKLLRRNNEV